MGVKEFHYEIVKLDWDSYTFGYPVGKAVFYRKNYETSDIREIHKLISNFKLLYIFVNGELQLPDFIMNNYSTNLVDEKVFFSRQIEPVNNAPFDKIDIKSFLNHPVNKDLLTLSFLSGEFSRFRVDKNFTNGEFEKLYTEWLIRSLEGIVADEVFVYEQLGKIGGFITCKMQDKICHIGLIAVSKDFQGKKIGSGLIREVNRYGNETGADKITVTTQKRNSGACRFYEKNGFIIEGCSQIYHLWNIK